MRSPATSPLPLHVGARDGRPVRRQKFLRGLAFVTVVATLAVTGFWMLFSNLAVYDDEGYVLISAREYFAHGNLYERIYSQYGPAFYVLTDLLQWMLGAPLENTLARLFTLTLWLSTALGCAGLVRRQTGSYALSVFTLGTTFLYLYFITDEPFHPGSLVFSILAISLYLLTGSVAKGRMHSAAVVAGAAGAALLLAKINVGIFYLTALVAWGIIHGVPARWSLIAKAAALTLLLVLAGGLMHTLWGEPWVQIYLALFASGAI